MAYSDPLGGFVDIVCLLIFFLDFFFRKFIFSFILPVFFQIDLYKKMQPSRLKETKKTKKQRKSLNSQLLQRAQLVLVQRTNRPVCSQPIGTVLFFRGFSFAILLEIISSCLHEERNFFELTRKSHFSKRVAAAASLRS